MINLKNSVLDLVESAKKQINNLDPSDALKIHGDKTNLFIDIRDIREIQKSGRILGAKHVPRCMLEFWIDPESPYHKTFFNDDIRFISFYATGVPWITLSLGDLTIKILITLLMLIPFRLLLKKFRPV